MLNYVRTRKKFFCLLVYIMSGTSCDQHVHVTCYDWSWHDKFSSLYYVDVRIVKYQKDQSKFYVEFSNMKYILYFFRNLFLLHVEAIIYDGWGHSIVIFFFFKIIILRKNYVMLKILRVWIDYSNFRFWELNPKRNIFM